MFNWRFALAVGFTLSLGHTAFSQSLDYQFYKTKVEPIFSKKREGHARCVVCHSEATNSFSLQVWKPETKAYTEEQTRKNFETASLLVVPGKPEQSALALHPLAHEAGGDEFHSGGRQFKSKDDPDWKVIAAWINGAK
jgi:hypothetical protein